MDRARRALTPAVPPPPDTPEDVAAFDSPRPSLAALVREAFETARGQTFEDGKESEFARRIKALVKTLGRDVVDLLPSLVFDERTQPDVAAEALKAIGRLRDPQTHDERRLLLEKALFSRSPYVRDAAVLGVRLMRDRHSLPWLKTAVEAEPIDDLRDDMKQAIRRLRG
jgi:hypothetical protein